MILKNINSQLEKSYNVIVYGINKRVEKIKYMTFVSLRILKEEKSLIHG